MNMTFISLLIITLITYILTHFFLISKEKVTQYKKIHEHFILPYVNDVLLFIESETQDVVGDKAMVEVNSDKIIKQIQKKASYGNLKLVHALYRYKNTFSYFVGKGEAKSLPTYEVFYIYLQYAKDHLQKNKHTDKLLLERIGKKQKLYGIAFVLTTILGKDEALKILSHKRLWAQSFLDKLSTELLEDLMDNYNHAKMDEHKLLTFLSIVKGDLFEIKESHYFIEIKGYIDEAIMTVKDRWVTSA